MLSFDIRSLDARAAQVDGLLNPDDPVWQDDDIRPSEPITVTGRLSSAGNGRYYFSGHFSGTAIGECRRCLKEVDTEASEETHLLFAESDDETTDDPDVFPIDLQATMLDLRPALREQWLLSVNQYALCSDECKGLCPSCGADLNEGACSCAPTIDNRWDALRTAR